MPEIISRRYQPRPDKCCEKCVFNRGEHAEWCEKRQFDIANEEIILWDILVKEMEQDVANIIKTSPPPKIKKMVYVDDDRCLCGGVGCNRCEPRGAY